MPGAGLRVSVVRVGVFNFIFILSGLIDAEGGGGTLRDGGPLAGGGEQWVGCGPFAGKVDFPGAEAEPNVTEVQVGGFNF